MNSLNSILIEGNLTRDPEERSTPKGTPVCNFVVASNRYFRLDDEPKQEVGFYEVETWSDLASRCSTILEKGRGVRVSGRLKQERWIDKEGNSRSKVKIVARNVEFKTKLNKKSEGTESSSVDPQIQLNEEVENSVI